MERLKFPFSVGFPTLSSFVLLVLLLVTVPFSSGSASGEIDIANKSSISDKLLRREFNSQTGRQDKLKLEGSTRYRKLLADPKEEDDKPFLLCALSNVKDEQSYIAQWVEYHRLMGVDHFFLGDDCSTDRSFELLKLYEAEGIVTPYQPSDCGVNHKVCENAIIIQLFNMAKAKCKYAVLFNDDEYFVRQDDLYKDGNIRDYLKTFSPMYIRLFDQRMVPPNSVLRKGGLVIASDTLGRASGELCKILVQTKVVKTWGFPHFPTEYEPAYEHLKSKIKDPIHAVATERRKVLVGSSVVDGFTLPFFLNHYMMKSLTEFLGGRASRRFTGRGIPNNYAIEPLKIYASSIKEHSFPPVGSNFTQSMVPKVEEALDVLARKYPKQWFFFNHK